MQSVVKVPISMTILKMVEEGKLRLDQMVNVQENDMTVTNQRSPIRDANPGGTQMTVEELLKAAISESDGTASDVLQRIAGGAEGVQRYLESLAITDMKIKYSHKEFGREWAYQYDNWATPAATVNMLRTLSPARAASGREQGLSKGSADLLLRFMTESNNPDNRLLGMLPEETLVAHKTGTGGTQDGVTSATNDVGIITLPDGRHIAIAVYIQDSKTDGAKPSEAIARIARAVFDKWSGVEKSEPVKTANFSERHTLN
jgi:beta-lactamase class A